MNFRNRRLGCEPLFRNASSQICGEVDVSITIAIITPFLYYMVFYLSCQDVTMEFQFFPNTCAKDNRARQIASAIVSPIPENHS